MPVAVPKDKSWNASVVCYIISCSGSLSQLCKLQQLPGIAVHVR